MHYSDLHTPPSSHRNRLPFKEKLGYALGDGATNIAWRGVATFLFVFYTDVFGLSPYVVGTLMLVARLSDGLSDIIMGLISDRTQTKHGKFRPWILWTAIPLAMTLSLLFTSPDLGEQGKILYAYITYIFFTLIFTANNIPYCALMGVMTGDDKERTSIGSYRMVGAFVGGMLVQGLLLLLVSYFGDASQQVHVEALGEKRYRVEIVASEDISRVQVSTQDGIATFKWDSTFTTEEIWYPAPTISFSMKKGETYTFVVEGESQIQAQHITFINPEKGFSKSIYLLSILLAALLIVTFLTTRERIQPSEDQKTYLMRDIGELLHNRPWLILLLIGLLLNVYNSIKQGIVVIYFTHYLQNQLLSASYLTLLMLASIMGAFITVSLSRKLGKRNLFIYALLFSALTNAGIALLGPKDIVSIFILGILSEFGAAILPTLFFVMLADIADYIEWKSGTRATGLVYSLGTLTIKFGGGIAGAITGWILGAYHYDGKELHTIEAALPGIIMLMTWIPSLVAILCAGIMLFYPLTKDKLVQITSELHEKRIDQQRQPEF